MVRFRTVKTCLHDATSCMNLVACDLCSILLTYLPFVKNHIRLRLNGDIVLHTTRFMQLVASCKQALSI
jgi:hypothetical protein